MPNTYRINRTLPNGWKIRLTFVPTGAAYDDAAIDLPDVCLLEFNEQVAEFDSLPYGLCKPQTLKFKLAFSLLPAAVQTFIGGFTQTPTPNVWILETDRGTNGVTYTVEYAGCEDSVEAVELDALNDGTYAYNVELVDVVYHCLKNTTGRAVYSAFAGTHQPPENQTFQILLRKMVGRNQYHTAIGALLSNNLSGFIDEIRKKVSTELTTKYLRTNAAGTSLDTFDTLQEIKTIPTFAFEFYKMGLDNTPRNPTTAITSATDLFVVTNLYYGGLLASNIGGLAARMDAYGWGRSDVTTYDLLRDLAETFAVKISYNFDFKTTGGIRRIVCNMNVRRIVNSIDNGKTGNTADAALSLDDCITNPSITVRGDNINKMEIRYETSNDSDATEIVRLQAGARASRSLNIEPLIHNIPVWLKEYEKNNGRSDVIKQTNLIYFKDTNGSLVKVHETTRVNYGPTATEYVKVSTPASTDPAPVKADLSNEPLQRTQLAAMQAQSSMTAALCATGLHIFANNENAIVECEFNYTSNAKLFTKYLAGWHELSGGPAAYFTTLAWARALPVSIAINWMDGTVKIKYYMIATNTTLELV